MGTDLGDGIEINYYEDQPPMKFEGRIDERWYWRVYWWDNSWIFGVATKKDHLNDLSKCAYVEHGHVGERIRPAARTQVLVEALKELVRSRVEKFRVEKGPREWLPVKKEA